MGSFGCNGRHVGQPLRINAIAAASDGNIYIGKVEQSKHIRKLMPVITD